jgi:hypothetical protein
MPRHNPKVTYAGAVRAVEKMFQAFDEYEEVERRAYARDSIGHLYSKTVPPREWDEEYYHPMFMFQKAARDMQKIKASVAERVADEIERRVHIPIPDDDDEYDVEPYEIKVVKAVENAVRKLRLVAGKK